MQPPFAGRQNPHQQSQGIPAWIAKSKPKVQTFATIRWTRDDDDDDDDDDEDDDDDDDDDDDVVVVVDDDLFEFLKWKRTITSNHQIIYLQWWILEDLQGNHTSWLELPVEHRFKPLQHHCQAWSTCLGSKLGISTPQTHKAEQPKHRRLLLPGIAIANKAKMEKEIPQINNIWVWKVSTCAVVCSPRDLL